MYPNLIESTILAINFQKDLVDPFEKVANIREFDRVRSPN